MDGIQTLPGQSEDGSCHGTDAGECTACRMADTSSSELGTETPAPAVVKDQLLAAWSDSVAGVHAYSSCVGTVDAFSDGHRLVVADDDRRLKVRLPWDRAHNVWTQCTIVANFSCTTLPLASITIGQHSIPGYVAH